MKKYIFIALIAVICLVSASVALAKEYITGYDVNNDYAPVQVEKGIYTPGISLYPTPMIGISTKSNLKTSGTIEYGGVEERWIEGTCANATTTPIQVINPWGSSAFVDRFLLEITNGTTSITFDIGTSTAANGSSTEVIADDVSMSTSTVTKLFNTSGVVAGTAGFTDPGTNSQEIFTWATGQYINMVVTEIGSTGGVTGGANTFACTYKIHSFK